MPLYIEVQFLIECLELSLGTINHWSNPVDSSEVDALPW